MEASAGSATLRIVIDIDGAKASFAIATPGIDTLGRMKEYRTADFPTATDCIVGFAREAEINLEGLDCAVAVSGAVSGDAIRIARCPWIISATGLGYLFKKPVHFLNDTAATLWAATKVNAITHKPLGSHSMPDFGKSGKWLGINMLGGLGAALLVRGDDGFMQHIETEAGHCAFGPIGEVEQVFAKHLERVRSPASWERALLADSSDPAWRDTPVSGDSGLLGRQRAEMLGSFVGDMILATGAWNGVLLFGQAGNLLSSRDHLALFDKRVESRANHQLNLRKTPRWAISIPNANLGGTAKFLDHRVSRQAA